MRFLIVFILSIVFFVQTSEAQPDTTFYYKAYKDKLVAGLYQSLHRYYSLTLVQFVRSDSTGKSVLHYLADANEVSGIQLNYDKLSIAFAYKSVPPQNVHKKGKTYYLDLGLSFGGNKWNLEASYRRYKGFYDINTRNYDSTYTDSLPYFQNPSMRNGEIKAKFLYFFNHRRFAYRSAYSCTYRQLKSAFSLVAAGNLYAYHLNTDSSFIPALSWEYYGGLTDWNGMKVTAFSAGGGFSTNLVIWKKLFLNLTLVLYPELQWRSYHHLSGASTNNMHLSLAGDVRMAFGFNGEKFFLIATSGNDFALYRNSKAEIKKEFLSAGIVIGYRFRVKAPASYRKFQETRLYKLL